jgi:hypothetical protein
MDAGEASAWEDVAWGDRGDRADRATTGPPNAWRQRPPRDGGQ